ncbi:MAG: phage holin family protein [Burkholderiales bacterium]|nr:phage holin family protein [Burkholderiales bacterium]
MDEPHGESGAWGAAKAKASSLLAIGYTRLQLLGNELEVGRISAMRQLMLALALVFCVGVGVLLTVGALVLLFWEQRLAVVSVAAALFWVLSAFFVLRLRQADKKTEPLFSASLAELQEDLRQLKAASGHGPSPD